MPTTARARSKSRSSSASTTGRTAAARRTRFVALTGGYHGETLGALSVTDIALYRRTYAPLLLEPIFAPSPDAYEAMPGESAAECARRRLGELRAILERDAHDVCAIIVEPLVQCAGGMRMHDASYLTGLRALCDEFDVHLIADEIAVGFGRTGTLFACEQAGIAPDLLCLSKGLTGGTLPLSAVLTTNAVYEAFYAEYSTGKAFLHSHSYTGNPIACSAALATLSVLHDEPVLERNRALAAHLAARIAPLRDHRARRRRAPDRHDRRDRDRRRQGDARAVSGRRSAVACVSIGMASNAASCCVRSATSSISCRRIASRRRRST